MAVIPFPSQVERWRDILTRMAPDIPIDFMLAWLKEESGGNVCATGLTQADKFEGGLFQTMHPQDDRYGATISQLRAGCQGQTLVDPSQVNAELQAQVGINLIRDYVGRAAAALTGSGVSWPMDSADFWTAVKQVHALPCMLTAALPAVVMRFGPPPDWATFREQAMTLSPGETGACAPFYAAPSLHGLRNRAEDTMANAEAAGKFGGGFRAQIAQLGSAGPYILLGAGAALFYLLYKRRR